jgi:hypothetical protein
MVSETIADVVKAPATFVSSENSTNNKSGIPSFFIPLEAILNLTQAIDIISV